MHRHLNTLSILLVCGLFVGCGRGMMLTSTEDTKVSSHSPDKTYGDREEVALLSWTFDGDPVNQRIYVNFNMTKIDTTKEIKRALLTLSPHNPDSTWEKEGDIVLRVLTVPEKWDESSLSWERQPSFDESVHVTRNANRLDAENLLSNIDVASLIREYQENPSEMNGFMIRFEDETPHKSTPKLAMREVPNSFLRPRLYVEYK